MALLRKVGVTAAAVLLVAGMAGAQEARPRAYVGNEALGMADMNSGSEPVTLEISGLADISNYAFDGSDLTIPFSLDGTQSGEATVWLIVYTSGQSPPLTITGDASAGAPSEQSGGNGGIDGNYAAPGWHVYQNVDLLVYRSDGQKFSAGANEIVWNGKDNDGNVVAAGSYDLFLAAFDADARAHIVGYAPGRGGSQELLIVDPDNATLTRPYEWVVDMTNDFHTNMNAAEYIDRSGIHDESAKAEDELTPTSNDNYWWDDTETTNFAKFRTIDTTPLGTSGNVTDDLTTWVAIGDNVWGGQLFTGTYDPVARTASVNTDWAADEATTVNGFLDYTHKQTARRYGVAVNPEGTQAYTTNGLDGTLGNVVVWDLATGAEVDEWDLSEIFLYRGGTRVGGPSWTARDYAGKNSEYGLTSSGHHTSIMASFEWDTGEVRWINRNGDHFGDMYTANSAGAAADGSDWQYGHPDGAGAKYGFQSTKWGWTTLTHSAVNNTDYGSMLGEDGSGLFKFQPTNIPSAMPWWSFVVDHNDSAWDGFYFSIGEDDPDFRSNDWAPPKPDDAIISYYEWHWLAMLPYDQKRVSLGDTPTAVAELGGETPDKADLGDAYPNPFNPETTIRFNLPWEAPVKVEVFNDQGQFVTTLVNDQMGPGNFTVTWDGRDANGSEVASGVYIYKINTVDLSLSKKVTFVK
jgi:flagellar hook assembly protein FlgD